MRKIVREFVCLAAETVPIQEPVYEFGSLQVAGQEGFADLRGLFPGKVYVGADMRPGLGVDRILNLHDIDLPAESVGTVLSLDTLEHVEFPSRAIENIHRILKPGGAVVLSSVMNFPIHDHPYDYWRFTPEAFRSLLAPFAASFVGYAGMPSFPHTVVGIGIKGGDFDFSSLEEKYRSWQQRPRFREMVKLLTPPLLLPALTRLAGLGSGAGRDDS